jgi:hypothetical protein
MCRQFGHNRARCPHDAATATSLREAFNRAQREDGQRRYRELQERQAVLNERARAIHSSNEEFRASMYSQVVDMQRRLEALSSAPSPGWDAPRPRTGPTVREVKIQEILFDHCQEIPDGLYKELMDALVIRG